MTPIIITYYVHGTTTDNEKGLSSGWHDCSLSELGKKQSLQLRNMIKSRKREAVFCSDLKRAVESAKLTYGNSVPILQDKRLREINYGDLNQADSEKVDSLILRHISTPFPNGESYKNVEKRMREFLNDLFKKYSGKSVDIVAHKAPQLALEVILRGRSWEQAVKEDWRLRKEWKPGWEYKLE